MGWLVREEGCLEQVWVTCTVLKCQFPLLPYLFARFHHSQRLGDTIHNSPFPPASPLPADMVHSQHFGDAIRNLVVWRYLVLDEGHKVKNEETLVSQVWREVWGRRGGIRKVRN